MKIAFILNGYVKNKDLGVVLGSRTLVKIDEKSGYEPEIIFISKERSDIIEEKEIIEAPDVVVEIISQSSRIHNRVDKFLGYQKVGVKEYWMIDSEEEIAEFYENQDGEFVQMDTEDGIFKSNAILDFWLTIEWVFNEVNEYDILEEILAKE